MLKKFLMFLFIFCFIVNEIHGGCNSCKCNSTTFSSRRITSLQRRLALRRAAKRAGKVVVQKKRIRINYN